MAKSSPIGDLKQEDFRDQPWISKLLWPLNRNFRYLKGLVEGGITFTENINSKIVSLTLRPEDLPLAVSTSGLGNRVSDVIPGRIYPTSNVSADFATSNMISWRLNNEDQLVIEDMPGLQATKQYNIRLYLLGETG